MSSRSYSWACGPLKIKGEINPQSAEIAAGISAEYSIVENSYEDKIIGEKSTSLLSGEPFVYSGEAAHVEGDVYDTALASIEKIGDL
ncbi:hypothetical protein N7455_003446 [Penicillium solitum]|uniref:uncharacterized protein n=1 Tax=Penicillium solitum TaxID=60172 RepID=UPI00184771BB|nr:hypothetical protein HAV15_005262 [Penicillium sp. str. \